MSKRKYPEVSGYWVYSIQVPSVNKYYIGISQMQCYQRWCKSHYKKNSLAPYLDEWDSMVKTVLIDGLSKEEAYQYEDNLIQELSMNNLCINTKRSGLIETSDVNAYMKEYRDNNTEYRENHKQLCKQWKLDNKEKWNEYRRQWYKNNPEQQEKNKQKCKQWRLKKKLESEQQHTSLL